MFRLTASRTALQAQGKGDKDDTMETNTEIGNKNPTTATEITLSPCPSCRSDNVAVIEVGRRFIVRCLFCGTCGPQRETSTEAAAAWEELGEKIEFSNAIDKLGGSPERQILTLNKLCADHALAERVRKLIKEKKIQVLAVDPWLEANSKCFWFYVASVDDFFPEQHGGYIHQLGAGESDLFANGKGDD